MPVGVIFSGESFLYGATVRVGTAYRKTLKLFCILYFLASSCLLSEIEIFTFSVPTNIFSKHCSCLCFKIDYICSLYRPMTTPLNRPER